MRAKLLEHEMEKKSSKIEETKGGKYFNLIRIPREIIVSKYKQ